MLYIIDANNLAGQLNLLNQDNFDTILIEKIKNYFGLKQHQIFLVFDSSDPMGDKFQDGNIIVIYTPKDNYYKNADDKILEIAETEFSSGYSELNFKKAHDQINIITDDLDLTGKIQKLALDKSREINIIKSTDFAKKIKMKSKSKNIPEENSNRGLNKDEINDINNELLEKFKKK